MSSNSTNPVTLDTMEAVSDVENVVKDVDQTTHIHSENTEKQPSGLTIHLETSKAPEEIRAEKRLVMKIDLLILPMLSLSLFLASLVSAVAKR